MIIQTCIELHNYDFFLLCGFCWLLGADKLGVQAKKVRMEGDLEVIIQPNIQTYPLIDDWLGNSNNNNKWDFGWIGVGRASFWL